MGMLQKENKTNQEQSPRQVLESKFTGARHNLLLVVIFTAINIVLLVTNSNTYFLFSAYIPYILTDFGMLFCGMYPDEIYAGELEGMLFLDKSLFVIILVIVVAVLALYLLSWYLSKKKVGWLTFALVFFSIDTGLMLLFNGITSELLIDIAFHGWVIYSLASGISAYKKLMQLPEESQEPETSDALQESATSEESEAETKESVIQNSPVLRFADEDVKARILLEAEWRSHKITYRRVKRVNELVVDGRVYDEYTALVEIAHTLCGCVDGHTIEAGYDGKVYSFITVDGEIIAKKVRLF